jgi:hypothetical protein
LREMRVPSSGSDNEAGRIRKIARIAAA